VSRLGPFFFKHRNLLFPVVFLPLALGTEPRPFLGSARADALLDAAGLALAIAGQALRVLVIGLAYIRRGGKDKKIYAASLVQDGIFAHSRNPLYLGNLMIVAGLMLIHDGPWLYAIGIPFFLVAYVSIVQAEEQYLSAHFGAEYEAYRRRVPRFLLRLEGLGRTLRSMHFDWNRVVRKEYGTLMSTASGVILLVARQSIAGQPSFGTHWSWPVLLAVWIALAVAWLAARVLKKSGALKDSGAVESRPL
jgi:protein-S-isoprenylcysteine O-methyltransferase Ste14